jgi:hypothetical protein
MIGDEPEREIAEVDDIADELSEDIYSGCGSKVASGKEIKGEVI